MIILVLETAKLKVFIASIFTRKIFTDGIFWTLELTLLMHNHMHNILI